MDTDTSIKSGGDKLILWSPYIQPGEQHYHKERYNLQHYT